MAILQQHGSTQGATYHGTYEDPLPHNIGWAEVKKAAADTLKVHPTAIYAWVEKGGKLRMNVPGGRGAELRRKWAGTTLSLDSGEWGVKSMAVTGTATGAAGASGAGASAKGPSKRGRGPAASPRPATPCG